MNSLQISIILNYLCPIKKENNLEFKIKIKISLTGMKHIISDKKSIFQHSDNLGIKDLFNI